MGIYIVICEFPSGAVTLSRVHYIIEALELGCRYKERYINLTKEQWSLQGGIVVAIAIDKQTRIRSKQYNEPNCDNINESCEIDISLKKNYSVLRSTIKKLL